MAVRCGPRCSQAAPQKEEAQRTVCEEVHLFPGLPWQVSTDVVAGNHTHMFLVPTPEIQSLCHWAEIKVSAGLCSL